MNILHTESSPGWGGQELRILREAEGMRARGHHVILAIQENGGLVSPAREAGFLVYEIPFRKTRALQIFYKLIQIIRKHRIEVINTHSSLDAWIGGLVGKMLRCRVVRTRHLSTPIRKGINSRLLYNWFADHVVTTCESVCEPIRRQAHLPNRRCSSIPTGIDPKALAVEISEVEVFRKSLGVESGDILVGTLCVLRGWKGVNDLLHAAKLLEHKENLKWVIVGSGPSEEHFKQEWKRLGLERRVYFTGHLSPPYVALAAMDIFALLSFAHEGVSQASLQAAWLEKPLITTTTGGLSEVCVEGETGFNVPIHDPRAVAEAVDLLASSPDVRQTMGERAKRLVQERFMLEHTLNQMEQVYRE